MLQSQIVLVCLGGVVQKGGVIAAQVAKWRAIGLGPITEIVMPIAAKWPTKVS